jgi:hypothetical protein
MRIPLRGTYDDGERLRTWRSWTEATGPLVDRNTMSALTSWKEISDYVGKGVRTVQRWESEFGFPIRRTKPGRKSVVLAIPSEIGMATSAAVSRWPVGFRGIRTNCVISNCERAPIRN